MLGNVNGKSSRVPNISIYPTAESIPDWSQMADNTIAVVSTTEKNKVYVSDVAPVNPQNGDIWVIDYDPAPRTVVQYNGSEWINKEAYLCSRTYRSKDKLATALFCEGTQFPQMTGSWTCDNGNLTIANGTIKFTVLNQSETSYILQTTNIVPIEHQVYIFGKIKYANNRCFAKISDIESILKLPMLTNEHNFSEAVPVTYTDSYIFCRLPILSPARSGVLKIGTLHPTSYGNEITISAIFVL